MIAIIGPSGDGKSTFADVFGFLSDCLSSDEKGYAFDGKEGGQDDEDGTFEGEKRI